MITEKMYEKMAELAVRKGVNVQPGQPLVVSGSIRDAAFVKLVVKKAYEAGAGSVIVKWDDQELTKMHYTYQTKESLAEVPDWMYDREKYEQEKGAAYLRILSDKPGGLKDVDPEKMSAAQQAYYAKMADLMNYRMNNIGQWCILGVPSQEWAEVVFPELDPEKAYDKLGKAIFDVTRVREDNDPVQEWEEHNQELIRHAEQMTEYQFDRLHFTSGLGTDVTVELVKDHVWVGGGCTTPKGAFFIPNMPTEEVFCMPLKTGVNGIVYASKPLNYMGKVIEDFWFKFENGKVVDFDAKKEKEALQKLLEFDEGSSYLGEVALVPYDSPISQSGVLFFNTLYDENAACHLALGRAYPENLKGGTEMSPEELAEHGSNQSMEHEDFMFGTADMSIDGIQKDGTVVPVFRNGNFVF